MEAPKIQYLIFLILFYFPYFSSAEEWEFLGNPPKGSVYLRAQAESPATPVQFAGTTQPAEIYMNGKKLILEAQPGPDPESKTKVRGNPGFWINDDEVDVSGEAGRFFKELSADEAAVASVHLKIRDRSGQSFQTKIALNRTFLDSAFSRTIQIPEDQLRDKQFTFKFSGRIPQSARLEVQRAVVQAEDSFASHHQQSVVTIPLQMGHSVLVATLLQANGSERVINVPIRVRKISHRPGKPLLAIRVPKGVQTGKTWVLPRDRFRISGQTNPGASLKINDRETKVFDDGRFESLFRTNYLEEDLKFEIKLSNGTSKVFRKSTRCPECEERWVWYNPSYHLTGEFYITGSSFGLYTYDTYDFGNRATMGFPISFGFGFHMSKKLAPELYFMKIPGNENLTDFGGADAAYLLSMPILFYPLRFLYFGIGPSLEMINTTTIGQFESGQSLAIRWNLGFRTAITRALEYTPRAHGLIVKPIINGSFSIGIIIEFLVLRYYFL